MVCNFSSLFLTLPGVFLFMQYIFHLGESYPRKCALTNPQNTCFPLKLIDPVHLEYLDIIHMGLPYFMCEFLEKSIIFTFPEKVMFAQFERTFEIHFTPSPGNSAIKLLLRKSKFKYRIFIIIFLT